MVMPSFVQPRSRSRFHPCHPQASLTSSACHALLGFILSASTVAYIMLCSPKLGRRQSHASCCFCHTTRAKHASANGSHQPPAGRPLCSHPRAMPSAPWSLPILSARCCPAAAPSRHTALHLPAQHRPTRRHLTANAGTPRDWLPNSDPASQPSLAQTLSPAPPVPAAPSANPLAPSCRRRRRRYAAHRPHG